jgi:hypothetical protein
MHFAAHAGKIKPAPAASLAAMSACTASGHIQGRENDQKKVQE